MKIFYYPPGSVYKHLHFKGVMDIKVDEKTRFKMNHYGYQLENEIFWAGLRGGWEKNSTELWIKLAKDSKTIFDIGANTGIYSLVAKAVNPNARVYSFEPMIRIYDKLQENIGLNNYDIVSYPVALSNQYGKIEITEDLADENNYSFSLNEEHNSQTSGMAKVEIETITLDKFIEDNHISGIDLIKMDVETHEGEVLEGFKKYLSIFKPSFLIEIIRQPVAEKVEACVKDLGYLYFAINEHSGITKVDHIIHYPGNYNYLLCSPEVAKKIGLI